MRLMFKAFAKKLFGAKYEKIVQSLLIYFIIFLGLHTADIQITISPLVFYLMSATFTAGVMWQALSSDSNASNMQNIFMLPFSSRALVVSYVTALGAYTLLTKTAALFSVLLAICDFSITEWITCLFCTMNAIFMTTAVFARKRYWYVTLPWLLCILAILFLLWDTPWFLAVIMANGIVSLWLVLRLDGYAFCTPYKKEPSITRHTTRASVLQYLLRYLGAHKNYLVNTVILWCIACVLPLLFQGMENLFVMPIGFAILSLNTPICILLSCDPALEQALGMLPGQKNAFCIPYCLFIFVCNLIANAIFLCSWQILSGGVSVLSIITALFFALQSAIGSVLLEWFCPIRNWKIESDLWHHPRKYVVPFVMMLLAGMLGMLPSLVFFLLVLLTLELVIIILYGRYR